MRNYGALFLGEAHLRLLRRQGDRHQPRAADQGRRPLHRRALGRQVPQDRHLPGGPRPRGERPARRRLRPRRPGRVLRGPRPLGRHPRRQGPRHPPGLAGRSPGQHVASETRPVPPGPATATFPGGRRWSPARATGSAGRSPSPWPGPARGSSSPGGPGRRWMRRPGCFPALPALRPSRPARRRAGRRGQSRVGRRAAPDSLSGLSRSTSLVNNAGIGGPVKAADRHRAGRVGRGLRRQRAVDLPDVPRVPARHVPAGER